MASREKARQFLKESASHEHYSSIVEYTLTYFIAKADKEGDTRFATDLRRAKGEYQKEFQQAIDITEQVYADIFTDEELDDLIVLHSNPALKKARALTADIMSRILATYLTTSA
ncbi:MAG: hypothetical protein ACE5I7_03275 [Candidatus Binatia bacterium]